MRMTFALAACIACIAAAVPALAQGPGGCPPGLAAKGCLPPGQAKKMWSVGQPLPPQVVYYPIQRELWTQLTPPPYGYEYVQVDDDIVLMLTATRVIASVIVNIGSFD